MEAVMSSSKNVQNTPIDETLRHLHLAVIEIVGAMNRPQRDEALLQEAGVRLDRALFPLLVVVGKFGPIGVVELANGVGRDYTTVSRQIAKLEALGLVARRDGEADRRVREAVVTAEGHAINQHIDAARSRLMGAIFADWQRDEIETLARLARKFADALAATDSAARVP
jgi:DNA-binding MarR family transcriptional regulator